MKWLFSRRPADLLTVLFVAVLLVLSVSFSRGIPQFPYLLATYSLLFVVQLFLMRERPGNRKSGFAEMVRDIVFPVVCILIIFESLELIVHPINPKDVDPLLIRIDYLLFGGYPTVMLESIQIPILTDLLQIAYSTYYFLPVSFGVALKLRGREREFDQALFLILLCFYLSYVGYLLFPALGPRYAMNHLHSTELTGVFFAGPIQSVLNHLEGIKRDAFPSGHTAVALIVSVLAYRYYRKFFWVTAPVVALLVLSTVYCRYHYVTDVIAGVILTGITVFTGDRLYGYWQTRHRHSC